MPKKIKSIEQRWSDGDFHNPKSIALANALAKIDEKYGDSRLDLKFGGDGDNGEDLMWVLDIYFEMNNGDL
jgi:hypothetical protein